MPLKKRYSFKSSGFISSVTARPVKLAFLSRSLEADDDATNIFITNLQLQDKVIELEDKVADLEYELKDLAGEK